MADAGWILGDALRTSFDNAVKAQFSATAKQQAGAQAIVAGFQGNNILELARNGVALLPIPIGTSPTVSGTQVVWNAGPIVTSQLSSFDIDSGTWTAVIRNQSGNTLTPTSVGKTTGVLRISADINTGQVSISFSITLTMPTFGTGGGGGGGGIDPSGVFTAGTPPGGFTGWTPVLTAAQSGVLLPTHFYGWHRDSNMGAAQFNYALHRSWDFDDGSGSGGTLWAHWNPAPGVYNWGWLDTWIDLTAGKRRVFTFSWTPEWAVEGGTKVASNRYPAYRYGQYAPASMAHVTAAVQAFYSRYSASQVPDIEVWNEPETGSNTDPSVRNASPAGAFCAMTMTQLVQVAKAIKAAVPVGVRVLGCGWEGDSAYGNNSTLFAKTSDGAGGHGIDHIDVWTFHPYEYNYFYNRTWVEAAGYRDQLQRIATDLGKPAVATKLIGATETGHESPGLAESTDANTVARGMKQMVGFAVAAHIAHGNEMQILYADKTDPRTFKGPINNSAVLRAAAEYCDAVNGGRTVRQVYIKTQGSQDPAVWIRFANNVEFVA